MKQSMNTSWRKNILNLGFPNKVGKQENLSLCPLHILNLRVTYFTTLVNFESSEAVIYVSP